MKDISNNVVLIFGRSSNSVEYKNYEYQPHACLAEESHILSDAISNLCS